MNKLDLLKTFVRVTELSSFTQAGESLGLPRSTASDQIRMLEDLVGARLFHRTTRKVQPTQDGAALYERSKELLADMDELEGLFRRDGAVLAGRLRVDMPTVVARKLVIPKLAQFVDAYPHIEVELSSSDRRVDLVRDGFDCVLRIGELPDASLVARSLGAMTMLNCASPAYLAKHGVPHTLDDLRKHRVVHYVPVLGARPIGFEYVLNGVTHQLPMAGTITVNNTDTYEAAALGGLGLIQSPVLGIRDHIESGRLVHVLPDFVAAPMDVSLLYANRRHLPQRAHVFMEWMTALIRDDEAQYANR
ncbi:LysR family transcriptional regulator [Pigmentiphaga aceris]|uniref:LysR family transcriptional regulator n=1 Tax=Pigmentiphaga aceris TaxID=1940612 RepID=A0A5C0AYQ2_9BURK|nr:LysR family transcriptional regulator [Pigmentiphaga aceris]QEI06734.1 LysR family transcriptional regulator [Pigmentiphaga aceris]